MSEIEDPCEICRGKRCTISPLYRIHWLFLDRHQKCTSKLLLSFNLRWSFIFRGVVNITQPRTHFQAPLRSIFFQSSYLCSSLTIDLTTRFGAILRFPCTMYWLGAADDNDSTCKLCRRLNAPCVRNKDKLKFRHGSTARYDAAFKTDQPWFTQSSNSKFIFFIRLWEL